MICCLEVHNILNNSYLPKTEVIGPNEQSQQLPVILHIYFFILCKGGEKLS